MLAMGQEIYHAKESPPNLTSCQYMKKHGKGKIREIAKVFGRAYKYRKEHDILSDG